EVDPGGATMGDPPADPSCARPQPEPSPGDCTSLARPAQPHRAAGAGERPRPADCGPRGAGPTIAPVVLTGVCPGSTRDVDAQPARFSSSVLGVTSISSPPSA